MATLNDIFFAALARNLDRIMLNREAGKWLPISSRQFGQRVARTAHALHAWGIQPGDRIAILSENRPEWPTADVASLLLRRGYRSPLHHAHAGANRLCPERRRLPDDLPLLRSSTA